ncbi:hypothetical protein [Streptomyces sp. NPDC051569]|uniref:hypothetical protein n=1 Tax=Streptomyces sp. NPDC051569 TaxID=3365661 RepID=UPI0037B6E15C
MTSTSTAQTIFARLVREHTDLTDIDRRIMRAFEELTEGRPQTTDGSLTVVNIAAEAGCLGVRAVRGAVGGRDERGRLSRRAADVKGFGRSESPTRS